MTDPLAEGAGWREVPEPAAPSERRLLGAPREARWAVALPAVDDCAWANAVAEAERVFGAQGLYDGNEAEWRWSLTMPRRQVCLAAAEVAGDFLHTVAVASRRPRPWLPALAWLCVPTAFVVSVVLLSRPSTSTEWLAVLAPVAMPMVAAAIVWAAEWIRLGTTRWRIRHLLRSPAGPDASPVVAWADAEEVSAGVEPSGVLLPEVVGPTEWLSVDEVEGLMDARPARVTPADLPHARRVVVRTTAELRASVPLPDGFTEWYPARTA